MGPNSSNTVLSLFLLLQLGGALAFVLVGLYVLYCFNRAATGLERMADVAEAWLALQHYQVARAAETAATPPGAPIVATQMTATPESPSTMAVTPAVGSQIIATPEPPAPSAEPQIS